MRWIPRMRIPAFALGLLAAFGGSLAQPREADAGVSLSVLSGFSLVNSAGQPLLNAFSPNLGFEALYSFNIIQLGAFYTNNFLIFGNNQSGSLRFFGPVFRIGLGMLIPGSFFDTRIGFSSQTVNSAGSDNVWAIGIGGGYRFNITPTISLSPRIGLNTEPYQTTTLGTTTAYAQTIWDFGMLVTFSF